MHYCTHGKIRDRAAGKARIDISVAEKRRTIWTSLWTDTRIRSMTDRFCRVPVHSKNELEQTKTKVETMTSWMRRDKGCWERRKRGKRALKAVVTGSIKSAPRQAKDCRRKAGITIHRTMRTTCGTLRSTLIDDRQLYQLPR